MITIFKFSARTNNLLLSCLPLILLSLFLEKVHWKSSCHTKTYRLLGLSLLLFIDPNPLILDTFSEIFILKWIR